MNIFVVADNFPVRGHTVRAATNVLLSCLLEFAGEHSVTLQVTTRKGRTPETDDERSTIAFLQERNVRVLPPFFSSDYMPRGIARVGRMVGKRLGTMSYDYPAVALRGEMERRITAASADVCFLFWSAGGLAATYGIPIPKLAYYGMPDHAARRAQVLTPELFPAPPNPAAELRALERKERHHLMLASDCDVMANLCAFHAGYYTSKGHPRSMYMPNMWPEPVDGPKAKRSSVPMIIGNIGRPAATGNTYGLACIGREILPALDEQLGRDGYEMHLLGQGEPLPAAAPLLAHPAVRWRGWVEDIDAEIRACDVFLVANNDDARFQGSHTRFLHAWSLGACCVGHSFNLVANPEMRDEENILCGEDGKAMANQVIRALRDPALRAHVATGGMTAYRTHFLPSVVAGHLLDELQSLV